MTVKLRNPRQALGCYLDEMLHSATSESAGTLPLEKSRSLLLADELLQPKVESDSERATEAAPPQAETSALVEESVDEAAAAAQVKTRFPMQTLMFKVGGHLLSIPLIQLSSVVNWSDSITRLPESPDWLLGLIKHRDINLRIVDSQILLNIDTETVARSGHLLVLGEGGWAITCDQLEQVINLEYADVQWKSGDHDQLMLGTIRDSLSTLLNPPGITRMLNQRDSSSPKL